MSDPVNGGHGPADPPGYRVEYVKGGARWTRIADGVESEVYPTRDEAVAAAVADAANPIT